MLPGLGASALPGEQERQLIVRLRIGRRQRHRLLQLGDGATDVSLLQLFQADTDGEDRRLRVGLQLVETGRLGKFHRRAGLVAALLEQLSQTEVGLGHLRRQIHRLAQLSERLVGATLRRTTVASM